MILERSRRWLERVVTTPGQELGRWARFIRFQIGLWRFCARRLRADNVMAMSAALSFRTIFALIPSLVLALLVLKSVGMLEEGKHGLRKFLDASGFSEISVVEQIEDGESVASPQSDIETATVINVADEIEEMVAGVEEKLSFERIGPVGGVLLIWTALTLLMTVERSLNRIFVAPHGRPLGQRVLVYWSAITLGPVILVSAAYVGREVMNTFGDAPGMSRILAVIGWGGPIIVGIFAVSGLYTLMPNTTVRYRAAFGGAVVVVPLWLVAKWGFGLYVQRMVLTGNLYGVLAVVPLFLLWLNLSWMIFLFGAELAYTAANLSTMERAERSRNIVIGPSDALAAALAIAQPFAADESPVTFDRVVARLQLPGEMVRWLIDQLVARNVVCRVECRGDGRYVLARAADRIPVLDILRIGDPRAEPGSSGGYDDELAKPIVQVQSGPRASLSNTTLADLLCRGPADVRP